ncbi:extradiol ring-cleavage dioxygenase [Cohnella candidum]|uniref:Extradiol ring-cleavage dioxygenase n=1 Tax=Cohnella candidum TaxID=2674991 RepID=A0A3G3JTL2_9BACL|nr:extradiol ring-cleavage dioxygenase [Cohnella candidum]AYQ71568.1 extradiol ring-cleavage dioxygenase [Cohnella candidum]
MSLEMALLVAHAPSMCHEENVPVFQQSLVAGLKKMRDRIVEAGTEVVVIISTHFAAPFHHCVDVTPHHKGILTAFEALDLISDVPYEYPGDEELGKQLAAAGKRIGVPVLEVNDTTYVWDYGTVVPLRYLVPNEDIAVVSLSVCLSAPLEETYRWGTAIGQTLREGGKKTVFVSSGALSHNLVRGRENMPSRSEQAMDSQFIGYLKNGQYADAREMLNQYSRIAGVESGGRHLAALLGVVEPTQKAEVWGQGQSSASWNAIISFAS